MKIKMKIKHILTLAVILLMTAMAPGGLLAQDAPTDKELLEKAKLDLFDRNWDSALIRLDQLITRYPDSSSYPLAMFYKGKCLAEQKKFKHALAVYSRYLEISQNRGLSEEATIAIIDLNYQLYRSGERDYLNAVTAFLESRKQEVRYYAAFKLSYAKDKKAAGAAVPVLKKIAAGEPDEDLKNRARLALMRIDPALLKKVSKPRSVEARLLGISVYDKKTKKETFTLKLPFMLARLAVDAIPDEEKKMVKKKGYNLDQLVDMLAKSPEVMRFEDDETIFKIWVE